MIYAPCHTGGENLANLIWWKIPSWPQSGSPFDAQPSIREKGFLWLSQGTRLSRTVCDPSVTFQKTGRGSGGEITVALLPLHGLCNESTLGFVFFQPGTYVDSSWIKFSNTYLLASCCSKSPHWRRSSPQVVIILGKNKTKTHVVRFEADNARHSPPPTMDNPSQTCVK